MNRQAKSKLNTVGPLLLCTSIFSIALGDVVIAQPQVPRVADAPATTSPTTAPAPLSAGLTVVGGVLLLSVLVEQYRRWCYLSLEPTNLAITAPSSSHPTSHTPTSPDLKGDPSSGALSS